jgi:phosphotriesterase-related protein
MSQVQTVSGPVDAERLGPTLVHEHLRTTSESVRAQFPHLCDEEAEYTRAVEEVRASLRTGRPIMAHGRDLLEDNPWRWLGG